MRGTQKVVGEWHSDAYLSMHRSDPPETRSGLRSDTG